MVLIFFGNFEKLIFIVRRANPKYNKFEHFSWGGVDALTIKISKQKFFGRVGVLQNWNLQIILAFIKNVPSGDELCLVGNLP